MKKLLIALLCSVTLFQAAQAQQKKSGAIQFQSVFDPAAMASANGIQLSDEQKARMPQKQTTDFELLFTPAQASYMPVEEMEDSNGSGGGNRGFGGMMMRFGGMGGNKSYYYDFAGKKLTEVFDLSDTTYFMESKLGVAPQMPAFSGGGNANRPAMTPPVVETVKSDETKKILGFTCNKYTIKTTRKMNLMGQESNVTSETHVWYTKELGFDFSPNPAIWQEGAVLAIESRGNTITAKSIEYRRVAERDVALPKKGISITPEAYRAKMESNMRRLRNGGRPTIRMQTN
ncbi:hypothetical protein C7T94_10120 [Pedobacter yulinensis]|uniref:GLPGLI family protein n=1 Tax=Pedobacter yulinensis TaxID=2126353 RepID=A0A2T3HKL5_9SPHI|nr:hypothetical protein [Pedobacter yulinensis]PST82974.1 hypothetical protein C7T94_10120 [Pedobacter yulinensis]